MNETENKMTEAEIMKALEQRVLPSEINCIHGRYEEACGIYCTKKRTNAEYCHDCKEHSLDYYGRFSKSILDLINRKNAEIERLTVTMDAFGLGMKRESERADSARAEAIKDFAERVKKLIVMCYYDLGDLEDTMLLEKDIDQIAKEMGVE